jgi:hypothetical protein
LGIGGTGENPNQLFIISIEDIKSNFVPMNKLKTIFFSTFLKKSLNNHSSYYNIFASLAEKFDLSGSEKLNRKHDIKL